MWAMKAAGVHHGRSCSQTGSGFERSAADGTMGQ